MGMTNSNKNNQEWKIQKKWNPFNSYKLLVQVDRWKHIKRGKPVPPPILVTVDPSNTCNLNCEWCNAEYVRRERKGFLSKNILLKLADFLPCWGKGHPDVNPGVKAICIAGGGEPLLNPATAEFIEKVTSSGIEVGVVTNGTEISKYIDSISLCTWVGVSIDAASPATFNNTKKVNSAKNNFNNIIDNINNLVEYSKRNNKKLAHHHPAYGVSYKYLLYKDNIGEIYQAAKLAKEIGCKNIHFRPAGTAWKKLGTSEEITFTDDQIALFESQIAKAFELDDENFGVYGVTHKFNSQFERANNFAKCYAVFMTAVIMPPFGKDALEDSFVLGLCCDRRGDSRLELGRNIVDVEDIHRIWGSDKHWSIHDSVRVEHECPRCTYQPHNEIFENVIQKDSMTYRFI
jgi:MoaA/NifB/PqqE/SkfB family radical SAM enzyme